MIDNRPAGSLEQASQAIANRHRALRMLFDLLELGTEEPDIGRTSRHALASLLTIAGDECRREEALLEVAETRGLEAHHVEHQAMLNRLALERHAAFIVRRLHTRRRGDIQREHRGRDDAADRMLSRRGRGIPDGYRSAPDFHSASIA